MGFKTICNILVVLFLVIVGGVLFVLQSLYFILRTTGGTERQQTKTVDGSPITIPALVICNRMPFSQDGVNSVNAILRSDPAMRYLLEWTNPSLREGADYEAASQSYMSQGETILFQYLPQSIRNQSINQMEYMCQSVINSCSYQGVVIQPYTCCSNVLYRMPTTKGMCWAYFDRSLTQNSSSPVKQFTITFQMSRNSWYSQQTTPVHPGIDVYLRENVDDALAVASQLESPLRVLDKKGIRLRMRKEKRVDLTRLRCGQTLQSALSTDVNAIRDGKTKMLLCVMTVCMRHCNCHPLLAEMIPYDVNDSVYREFFLRVNRTQVCTIEDYERCARFYMDFTRPQAASEPVTSNFLGADLIEQCRRDYPSPCVTTSYTGTVEEYDLPALYQSTQDFVARLVLEYSTTRVTEVVITHEYTVLELLSYIGYNFATWFAIGHVIWSLYAQIRSMCHCCMNKITPASSQRALVISQPVENGPDDEAKQTDDDAS